MNFDIIFQESGPFRYSQQFRQSTAIKKTYKEANWEFTVNVTQEFTAMCKVCLALKFFVSFPQKPREQYKLPCTFKRWSVLKILQGITSFNQGFWQDAAKNRELCGTVKVNCAAKTTNCAANCAAVNS